MNYEKKKNKLERYRPLLDKFNILKNELEEFEKRSLNMATRITVGELDKIRTVGGKNDLNKVSAFAERDELYKLKLKEMQKTFDEMKEILVAINGIENIDFQNAVYCYFVQDMSYAEIAFQCRISEDTARWRNTEGIKRIKF